jgi:hypothetical protein
VEKLHNEELHSLYCSSDIIRMIKPRRMRRVEHVACMGEVRNANRILVRKPEEKRWEGERVQRCELDSYGSGQGPVAGSSEHTVMNLRVP